MAENTNRKQGMALAAIDCSAGRAMTALGLTVPRSSPRAPVPLAWSFKLATVAGTAIYVHGTFFLLIAWFAIAQWLQTGDMGAVISSLGLLVALFTCVVLHEFGHVLVARRFDCPTSEITLLPIGGIARLERLPRDPKQALAVALAGPAVNVALAIALFALLVSSYARVPSPLPAELGLSLDTLLFVNLTLAMFNLLPGLPLDGGRALQALLTMKVGELRATQMAARLGQGMALWFAAVGVFGNPFLLLVALFVWLGAGEEGLMAESRAVLAPLHARDLARPEYPTLAAGAPLTDAAALIARNWSPVIAVQRDHDLLDVVTRHDVFRGLARHPDGSVDVIVRASGPELIDAEASAAEVLARLERQPGHPIVVVDGGRVAGVITKDVIEAFVALRAAGGSPSKR